MSAIRDHGGAVASAVALQRYQALLAPEPAATAVVEPDAPAQAQRFEMKGDTAFVKTRFGWRRP